MASIRGLSWAGGPLGAIPMQALDARYWLGAQQGSTCGLHVALSHDLSNTRPRSQAPRESEREQTLQETQTQTARLLLTILEVIQCPLPLIPLVEDQVSESVSIQGEGTPSLYREREYWVTFGGGFQKRHQYLFFYLFL